MIIGIPKENKDTEARVAATVSCVRNFTEQGHTVLVEKNAGLQSGFTDEEYKNAGAQIVSHEEVWTKSQMIYKVKEPQECDYKYLREGLIIFAYLHLAANEKLFRELVEKKCIGIAFETVEKDGKLPLLKPMSEIAGRLALVVGGYYLANLKNGKGMLIDGVPGVKPANVVIIGTGTVGTAAAKVAVGMGARVTVIGRNTERLGQLIDIFGNSIETLYSNEYNIAEAVKSADLVISTVLITGALAPKLVTEEMVKSMGKGSVIVDVSIDQGGSIETTANHPTTHSNPVFEKYGVIHYAVANIPGSVPKTSTQALSNATSYYALKIANEGWREAIKGCEELKKGVNMAEGYVTFKALADEYKLPYTDALNI